MVHAGSRCPPLAATREPPVCVAQVSRSTSAFQLIPSHLLGHQRHDTPAPLYAANPPLRWVFFSPAVYKHATRKNIIKRLRSETKSGSSQRGEGRGHNKTGDTSHTEAEQHTCPEYWPSPSSFTAKLLVRATRAPFLFLFPQFPQLPSQALASAHHDCYQVTNHLCVA